VLQVEIGRVAFPACGGSELRPTTDLVGGALETLRIDETFHHRQRMTPALQPVGGEPPEHELHKPADQIGAVAVRKHQQARIVGQERTAAPALLGRPADALIPRLEMEGGSAPGGHGQPPALEGGGVAQMLPDESGLVQVMFRHDVFVAPGEVIRSSEGTDLEPLQNGLLIEGNGFALGSSHPERLKKFRRHVPKNRSTPSPPRRPSAQ
jgi:hypothetical protein